MSLVNLDCSPECMGFLRFFMNFKIKSACVVVALLFVTSSYAKIKFEIVDEKKKIATLTIVEKIEHEEDHDFIFFYNRLVANCASACVYVLIGGVVRMAYGRVAVHRTLLLMNIPVSAQ